MILTITCIHTHTHTHIYARHIYIYIITHYDGIHILQQRVPTETATNRSFWLQKDLSAEPLRSSTGIMALVPWPESKAENTEQLAVFEALEGNEESWLNQS